MSERIQGRSRRSATIGAVLALGLAVQLVAAGARAAEGDPLEPVNRAIFNFNDVLDGLILGPISTLYGMVVPARARASVHNALSNLGEPVIFANDLLQGNTDDAGQTLARFMINSSLGAFGLFDPATTLGHPYQSNDFGLTLAHYGMGPGPYLVLPVFGPSNPRDAAGLAVDGFVLDPVAYIAPTDVRLGIAVARGIDTRYQLGPSLADLKANSLDYYATVRTVAQQHRAAQVSRATPGANQAYEDIFNENFDDQPKSSD